MTPSADDDRKLISDARNALQRRDGVAAKRYLEELAGANMPWLMMAQACNLLGDVNGEEAALQTHLEQEPLSLPALLLTGELKAREGDDRAAISFFQAAVNRAAVSADIPPQLHAMLTRAQNFIQQAGLRFQDHLLDQLSERGISKNGRIGVAVDLLLGKKQLYLQQPSSFYFPGLPQRQFYERDEFSWLSEVEAAIPHMQDELRDVLSDEADFPPYVQGSADRPRAANPLIGDPSWGAFYHWRNGEIVVDNAVRCPRTRSALVLAPMPKIDKRSPMALWSLLKPRTKIIPHHGLLNTRLICHLPLIVPGNCGLRVGNETREWQEGKALIFDDSFEHEAWNQSDAIRVVLLFEIWCPEISLEEREALTAIFETINYYKGLPEDAG